MKAVTILFILWVGALAGQPLDGAVYISELTEIAEKAGVPGAYKGKIAIEFANYYNTTVQKYPADRIMADTLTNRVADAFSVTFVMLGTTMQSAQFPVRDLTDDERQDKKADSEINHSINVVSRSDTESTLKAKEEGDLNTVATFREADRLAEFPGCEYIDGSTTEKSECTSRKMLEFVYRNIIYPEDAKINKVEGQVFVQFTIGTDGIISDATILKSLGHGCDEASLLVVESMNQMDERWVPAMQDGVLIKMQYTLPILFKLQ